MTQKVKPNTPWEAGKDNVPDINLYVGLDMNGELCKGGKGLLVYKTYSRAVKELGRAYGIYSVITLKSTKIENFSEVD